MKPALLLIAFLFFAFSIQAQDAIKNVLVETYYVANANDATDTTGGKIEVGTKTYRIYVKLKPGCKLKKIYGNSNHTLKFSSTHAFFNNSDRGTLFAKDIIKNYYGSNTVALDSWITIGQISKKATLTYAGVPKFMDNDGSFVGGANNDGGSASIVGGLLTNNDALAGVPLTNADGISIMDSVPSSWLGSGFTDSTIFGSSKTKTEFISNSASLQCTGVKGVNVDSNYILVAQLTTKGEISFELNLQVYNPKPKGQNPTIQNYVAKNADFQNGEYRSPFLTYPFLCGCLNVNYNEFNDTVFAIHSNDSCKVRRYVGCMDPLACNYDKNANFNIDTLCCYPGSCLNRDISLVCPNLGNQDKKIKLYPNPVHSLFTLETNNIENEETRYEVYNSFGNIEIGEKLGKISGDISENIDATNLNPGIYLIRVYCGNTVLSERFIKD
ncbi:MAG: T9SS type A sorting domain-containing protein [Bacteroidota bacterium]